MNEMMNKKERKELYIEPKAEFFELAKGLNLLNSTSLGGKVDEWLEGEDENWGEFVPYP